MPVVAEAPRAQADRLDAFLAPGTVKAPYAPVNGLDYSRSSSTYPVKERTFVSREQMIFEDVEDFPESAVATIGENGEYILSFPEPELRVSNVPNIDLQPSRILDHETHRPFKGRFYPKMQRKFKEERTVVACKGRDIRGNVVGRTGEIKRDQRGDRFIAMKTYVRDEPGNIALQKLGEKVDGWTGSEIAVTNSVLLSEAETMKFSHFFREERKKPTPIEIYRKDQMAPAA